MVKANIAAAVRQYWPDGKEKIGKKEAAELLERALSEAGILTGADGRKMQNGIIDTHRRALCLMSPEMDGSYHLQPLRDGMEVDVLIDPQGGWQRCKVVEADTDAPTYTRIDAGDPDAPVIGAPARIPLQIDGSGMPSRTFAAIETAKDAHNGHRQKVKGGTTK